MRENIRIVLIERCAKKKWMLIIQRTCYERTGDIMIRPLSYGTTSIFIQSWISNHHQAKKQKKKKMKSSSNPSYNFRKKKIIKTPALPNSVTFVCLLKIIVFLYNVYKHTHIDKCHCSRQGTTFSIYTYTLFYILCMWQGLHYKPYDDNRNSVKQFFVVVNGA